MRCSNYFDRDAIGRCKYCHKGLCPECSTDLPAGISCREPHEQRCITSGATAQAVALLFGYHGDPFSATVDGPIGHQIAELAVRRFMQPLLHKHD